MNGVVTIPQGQAFDLPVRALVRIHDHLVCLHKPARPVIALRLPSLLKGLFFKQLPLLTCVPIRGFRS